MYASLGMTTGALSAAAFLPDSNAFLQVARLSLAAAGLVFACYALALAAVAVAAGRS